MSYESEGEQCKESYEQFVQRASCVFLTESVSAWSRVERAVFNHLMGQLVRRYSYGEISNAMLQACWQNMNDVIHRLKRD